MLLVADDGSGGAGEAQATFKATVELGGGCNAKETCRQADIEPQQDVGAIAQLTVSGKDVVSSAASEAAIAGTERLTRL